MEKLLSIVIPVYNTEKYIGECINSILNQTYKNIEVICIDDCSPDNSALLIKKIMEKDSRVKYILHNENKFQGGARNTGIDIACGEYITFIDSDDYIADINCYKTAINNLEKYNADISIFSFFEKRESSEKNYKISSSVKGFHKLNKDNFTKVHCSPWNKIFILNHIKEYSLYFPEKIKFEDESFWYKYVAAVEPKAYTSDRPYYCYRIHGESTMAHRDKFSYNYLDVTLDILNYLEKIGKKDFYKEHILNLLYSPATTKEIYTLDDKTLKQVAEKFKKIIDITGLDFKHINNRIGACIYAYFIEDRKMRENYLKTIEILKPVKYKILKHNKKLYKLKREILRIKEQIFKRG